MSGWSEYHHKKAENAKLIEHMLSEVESDLEQKGRTSDFIESLRSQFNERKSLSEKQITALKGFYERV